MKTSLLLHGTPKDAGAVRVPFEFIPDTWEALENPEEGNAPEHSISYKVYHNRSGRVCFYNCNPCARDGGDQAAFQHIAEHRVWFLSSRGVLASRWIRRIEPEVITDPEREYIESASWVITYQKKRP